MTLNEYVREILIKMQKFRFGENAFKNDVWTKVIINFNSCMDKQSPAL